MGSSGVVVLYFGLTRYQVVCYEFVSCLHLQRKTATYLVLVGIQLILLKCAKSFVLFLGRTENLSHDGKYNLQLVDLKCTTCIIVQTRQTNTKKDGTNLVIPL